MDEGAARERLVALRRQAARQLESLSAELAAMVSAAEGSNVDDEHDPEGATIAFEREQLATVREQAQRRMADADAALDRLTAGRYGVCERCGRPIAEARLEALPATSTCVACASRGKGG